MKVRSVDDIAALIRDRRRALALDQATLAKRIGVSREWIIGIEKGNPNARLDLVLRTLAALGVSLEVDGGEGVATGPDPVPDIDLDELVQAAGGGKGPGQAGNG